MINPIIGLTTALAKFCGQAQAQPSPSQPVQAARNAPPADGDAARFPGAPATGDDGAPKRKKKKKEGAGEFCLRVFEQLVGSSDPDTISAFCLQAKKGPKDGLINQVLRMPGLRHEDQDRLNKEFVEGSDDGGVASFSNNLGTCRNRKAQKMNALKTKEESTTEKVVEASSLGQIVPRASISSENSAALTIPVAFPNFNLPANFSGNLTLVGGNQTVNNNPIPSASVDERTTRDMLREVIVEEVGSMMDKVDKIDDVTQEINRGVKTVEKLSTPSKARPPASAAGAGRNGPGNTLSPISELTGGSPPGLAPVQLFDNRKTEGETAEDNKFSKTKGPSKSNRKGPPELLVHATVATPRRTSARIAKKQEKKSG